MKRCTPMETTLRVLTVLAVVGSLIFTLMSGEQAMLFQQELLNITRHTVAVIIGEGSFLIEWAPLLLKLLFFMTLALLIWSILLIKGTNRRSALVGGLASVVILAVALEVLQFVLPYRQPSMSDFLWCVGSGGFVSVFLFLGQWAWERWPSLVNRETVLYVVFGAITTVVNIVSFQFCFNLLDIPTLIANGVAWILSVLVAYVTNKLFVFQSHNERMSQFFLEVLMFFAARLLSFGIDELGMWLMVDIAHIGGGLSKVAMNVVVLILNYIFSKWLIFSSHTSKAPEDHAE